MTDHAWRRLGAGLAMLAVMLGAFGAHALAGNPRVETWKTGAHYQLVHAVALCIPGLPKRTRQLLLAGIVLFGGSLYGIVLTGVDALGAIAPFGGISFMAGWAWFAWKGPNPGPGGAAG